MKNYTKKIISMLLATIMMLGTLSNLAFASDTNATEPLDGFYVTSGEVPQEAIEHTQNSIGGMIKDLFDLRTVKIGSPFKVSGIYFDLYYFIVYSNDEIVGTYRVYESDNTYTGIFSENTDIISGLEAIKGLTSPNNPAKIVVGNYDDIYAVIDFNVYTILDDFEGNVTDTSSLLLQPQAFTIENVVDVSEGISFDTPRTGRAAASTYKYLQVGWAETQSSLPWCMAYVTASIMRYKKGYTISTISSRKVMQYAYPTLSTADLEKEALSIDKSIEYANSLRIYPTYTTSRRTYSQVQSDINADSPLAFICDNVNTGAKRSHAFVCRGYDDNSGNPFYSIWNPWYTQFERIYTSNNTYVNSTGSAKYLWSATMYNWK